MEILKGKELICLLCSKYALIFGSLIIVQSLLTVQDDKFYVEKRTDFL